MQVGKRGDVLLNVFKDIQTDNRVKAVMRQLEQSRIGQVAHLGVDLGILRKPLAKPFDAVSFKLQGHHQVTIHQPPGEVTNSGPRLQHTLPDIGPDAILTFGPDGEDGYAGHRMISDIVTEIVLAENWVERYPLYYLGRTRKEDEKYARFAGVNIVAAAYLPVAVSYTQEDESKALEALRCNKSQFSADEINRRIAVEKKDTSNTIRFRQLVVSTEKKNGF